MPPSLLGLPREVLECITEYIASVPEDPTDTLTRIERRTPEVLSWRAVNRYTRDQVKYLQDHPTTKNVSPLGVRYVSDIVKLALGPNWSTILDRWDAIVEHHTGTVKPGLTKFLPGELTAFKRTSHNMMTELHWTPPTRDSLMDAEGFVAGATNTYGPYYTSQGQMFEAILGAMASDPDIFPNLQKIVINDRDILTDPNDDDDKNHLSALVTGEIALRNWTGTNFKNSAWRTEMLQGAMMIGKCERNVSVCATMSDVRVRTGQIYVDSFPRSTTIHANRHHPRFKVTRRRRDGQISCALTHYYSVNKQNDLTDLETTWQKIMTAAPLDVTAHFHVGAGPNMTNDEAEQHISVIADNIHSMVTRLNRVKGGSSIRITVNDANVPSCKLCGRTFFSWPR